MLLDHLYFALNLYGEARGENDPSKRAIAWVIQNHFTKKMGGNSYQAIVLRKSQFSCWKKSDPNHEKLKHPGKDGTPSDKNAWQKCKTITKEVRNASKNKNPIPEVCHYFSGEPKLKWQKNILTYLMCLIFILLSSNEIFAYELKNNQNVSFEKLKEKIKANKICEIKYNSSKTAAIVNINCGSAYYINFKTHQTYTIIANLPNVFPTWMSDTVAHIESPCGTGCSKSIIFIALLLLFLVLCMNTE